MKIKSFEVSENGETGDILSADRKKRGSKLRVGLVCAGWFEWWQMFSHTNLEASIKNDAEQLFKNLKKEFKGKYNIIYPGMIDTLDNACDVGHEFRRKNVDMIIIVENTYVTDFIPLEVIDHFPNVPVIAVATQATKVLPPDMDTVETVRYEGLVGITQLIGAFKKMSREYSVVAGAIDDPEMYKKLEKHFKVAALQKKLKLADVGLLGHTFRGMYDIEIDKTKMKGKIGPNVVYIDVKHLINIWEKVTDKEIYEYQKQIDKEFPIKKEGITKDDVKKSLRVGIALERLSKRFNLDGISILGQHHLEIATRTSTDFSHYSVEQVGCMHTCEGDMGNLVMKIILYQLSNAVPVFLEWTAFDEPSNTLFLTHHGVVSADLCSDIKKCRWTKSPEKWDFTGNGMSVEYCGKAGKVTLASLIDDYDGWKILISQGECIERDPAPCCAPQFYFRPEIKITTYIEKIMTEGVTHHICLAYGDYRKELEMLADSLKIKKVII